MDLTDAQLEVLREIAKNPGKDKGEIGESLDKSKSSVSSIISDLREYGLIVRSQGNGAVRQDGSIKKEPDNYEWLITGASKRHLRDHYKELEKKTRKFQDAYLYAQEYLPKNKLSDG